MSAQHSGKIREWFATHIFLKPPAAIRQTYWEATHPHTGDPVEALSPCHRRPMVKDTRAPGGWRCTHPIHEEEERARIAAQSTVVKREKSGQFADEFLKAHPEMRKPRYPTCNPLTPLPPTRQATDAIPPVTRQTSGELMPTMRADTPREGLERLPAVRVPDESIRTFVQHIQRGRVANMPTIHDEVIPQDHFLIVGPDALFEPMDKVPTVRQLTEAERAAMTDATDSLFELPAQPGSNIWQEFEAMASKSGLLPVIEQWRMEMPTAEVPTIHRSEQAERAAARRARYQLPDIEQRERE